jgi:hypothetical protein
LRSALEEPTASRDNCIPQPLLLGVDNGVAGWMDRIKGIGNGQVPSVVKLAWETLSQ